MRPLRAGDPSSVGGHRLLGRLGAGGMGTVYLARSPGGALVALKVIAAGHAADPEFRRRFRREVAVARGLRGRWLVPVVAADPEAREPWLATVYVPGPSLAEAVAAYGPLPPATVRVLGARLAAALAEVHAAGLVHRDVKPGNVLLAPDGPRLIDFGVARGLDATALTAAGAVVGTPGYLSPEQARAGGPAEVGPPGDVFALGCLLVFASTGRGPFGGGNPAAVVFRTVHEEPELAGVPAALVPLVRTCLAKDPALRPSARELCRALGGEEDGEASGNGGVERPAIGGRPTDGARPTDGVCPTDGAHREGGAHPESGAHPADGRRPENGAHPESRAHPAHGVRPEDGAHPADGTRPDNGAQPESGAHPEDGPRPESGTHPENRPHPESGTHPENGAHPAQSTRPEDGAHPAHGMRVEDGADPAHGVRPQSGRHSTDRAHPEDGAHTADRARPMARVRPVDGKRQGDGPHSSDGARPADGAPPADTAAPAGTARPTDTAHPADTPPPADTARPADTSAPADTAAPAGTARPTDTAYPADRARPADAARPADTAAPADTSHPADAARPTDASYPTGAGAGWLPAPLPQLIAERAAGALALPVPEPTAAGRPVRGRPTRRRLLAAGGAFALAAAGTGVWLATRSGGTGPGGGGRAVPPTRTIGFHADLSGPGAEAGLAQRRGAELAVEAHNSRTDAAFRLLLRAVDDAGERARAARAAAEFAADPSVLAVLGPSWDAAAEEVAVLYDRVRLPALLVSADGRAAAGTRSVFATRPPGGMLAVPLAHYLAGARPTSLTAVVRDAAGGTPAREVARAIDAEEPASSVVITHQITLKDTDFTLTARSVVAGGAAGVVYAGTSPARAALLARALAREGFRGPRVAPQYAMGPAFLRGAGAAGTGWVFGAHFADPLALPGAWAFVRAHRAAYGVSPGRWAVEAYDAVGLLAAALAGVGTRTSAGVRGELAGRLLRTSHQGVAERLEFDPATRALPYRRGSYLYRAEGGTYRFLGAYDRVRA
ncbi:ABC transporter substrate-binding protein [Streptomyces sp. NPDC101118]|uniref:bifunctional serine/threonine-protein kinase/ABC transporter substrate-binding protein n=1 Tax=Streptomyces sp. NPDC101118 TaxID=3366109 RepID=UPI0037F4EAF7